MDLQMIDQADMRGALGADRRTMNVQESYHGALTGRYTFDKRSGRVKSTSRGHGVPLLGFFKSAFLPQGYPQSVSKDYMEYQIWDTVQALASSVVGTLAGQALLLGVGVGNAGATILAATLTWMFRDGAGMIGRIAFAGRLGTSLDSQCKQWRLFADLLNDCALFLDLISAHFLGLFTAIVCVSSVLKSLVGLAGGATRAAVTQHQALQNNMADVAAKDASQETLSNFLALLLNFVLVHIVTGNWLFIWLTFWILTPLHLYSNWRAVRCLQFRTLNKARFHIITQDWFAHMSTAHKEYPIASVQEVNRRERIVSIPFLTQSDVSVHLGCSFNSLSGAAGSQLQSLFAVYQAERYLLFCEGWRQAASPARHLTFWIGLRKEADVADQLKALLQVEIITSLISNFSPLDRQLFTSFCEKDDGMGFLSWTLSVSNHLLPRLVSSLRGATSDWYLDVVQFDADEWRIDWGVPDISESSKDR
nr:unnamed protein product [Spirometra erinaceieuropaei]